MSEKNKHVIFKGQIAAGAAKDMAKQKLAALFKINVTQAETMFSGKPIYIKKNVDLLTAQKYQAAMQKAGAIAEIVSLQTNPASQPAATATKSVHQPAQTSKEPTTTAISSAVVLPGSSATSDIPDTEAPQIHVQLDANADISAISMAETGAMLQKDTQEVTEPAIDLSGLSLVDIGKGELSQKNEVPAIKIDTSELSLE